MKLIEKILDKNNVREALNRVIANHGTPGIDGMAVEELRQLDKYQGVNPCERVSPQTGAESGNTQAQRRGAQAWYTKRCG